MKPDAPERLSAALADRYAIVRELGPGGMATGYLAEDRKHPRDCYESSYPPSSGVRIWFMSSHVALSWRGKTVRAGRAWRPAGEAV